MTRFAQVDPATSVTIVTTVEVPVERAFEVFTSGLDIWWHRELSYGKSDKREFVIEPRLGGRWFERTDMGDFLTAIVQEIDTPNHIAFAWGLTTLYGYEPDITKNARLDIWFDAVSPTQTTVTLIHSDVDKLGRNWEPMRDRMASDMGWGGLLKSFARVAVSLPAEVWAKNAL